MSVEDTRRDQSLLELLHHAADVVYELGVDGRILYVSAAIEGLLGRAPEAFTGRSFLEVIAPEDRAENLTVYQKVLATGADALTRFRIPRSDGLRVEFESSLRAFAAEDGTRRLVGVARDITQQAAERAVDHERDRHYRRIVESGDRPAAIMRPEGDVVFSNQSFKKAFGRDIHSDDILRSIGQEDRHALEMAWFESCRADRDGVGGGDFEYSPAEGDPIWFSARWSAFLAESGERWFTVLYEDISRRKNVEHALASIASDLGTAGTESLERIVGRIATALDFDRLIVGGLFDEAHQTMAPYVDWHAGEIIETDRLEIDGLPDAIVASGESVVYRADVAQLLPRVRDRIGPEIESYAGVPLRRADGTTIGLIGGYGRHPITDADQTRSLLSAFAAHAASAVDRRRADAEIRANQDRFDVVSRQSDEALVEIDGNNCITYASQATVALLGYAPNSLIGRRIESLTHAEDVGQYADSRHSLASGATRTRAVTRIRHANGDWRWIESRASPYTDSEGATRALIIARDVTERRREELERDLLYRVVQQGADLVFVCDPDSTLLLFANESAILRLGAPDTPSSLLDPTPRDEAGARVGRTTPGTDGITRSDPMITHAGDSNRPTNRGNASPTRRGVEDHAFYELLPPEEAVRLRTEILPQVTPDRAWSGELHVLGVGDTTPIPTEAKIFLFDGSGEANRTYLGITLQDREEHRTAEEALRQSEFRLNQAQKMEAVGRLAGGIAHDFNNLLTAIIGYGDLVLDEIEPSHAAHRDAEEILRAAERAGGLTRQLLAFSRRQVLQPESVDLNAIVADTDRMMRRLIGENIEFVTAQDGELGTIVADPGQIEQVIVNLVVNARDAMPQGGRIELETANRALADERATDSGILAPGRYATLSVSDSGVGMDEETRARIFEPFFTTKDAQEGTGLGLASVYGIVSQSGGQIDVVSSPDAGTRFTVYFPVAALETEPASPEEAGRRQRGTETILLVEDAQPVRLLVERTLRKAGYKVLTAESATAALRHCSRHAGHIDLILTDVVLPKIPGPEIARRARELRPDIRVLFMSGFTDETLSRHGLDPMQTQLIEKPFTSARLLERVRSVFDLVDASQAASTKASPGTPE